MNKISEHYYHYKGLENLQALMKEITATYDDTSKYRIEFFISDDLLRASIYVMDKYDEVNL